MDQNALVPLTPPPPDLLRQAQPLAILVQHLPTLMELLDAKAQVAVGEVIDKYLANCHEQIGEDTIEWRKPHLLRFKQAFGPKRVIELTPFDLKSWMAANVDHMRSDWTKTGVKVAICRALNWAAEVGIVKDNPLRHMRLYGLHKPHGRDLKKHEFQAVLRHVDVGFRQFLITLRYTGARPNELARLKWKHINWERSLAILKKHKTFKKTGKPRVLYFPRQILKLLTIIKRDAKGSCTFELLRMLEAAPDRSLLAYEITYRMKQHGFPVSEVYRARKRLGVELKRLGQGKGVLYILPPVVTYVPPPPDDHVFHCSKGTPWNKRTWGQKFRRVADQIGLPKDCKVYGLRHYFATEAVGRGVPMKPLSEVMGHEDTRVLDRTYAHLGGNHVLLHETIDAAVSLKGTPTPLPLPTDRQVWDEVVEAKYPKAKPKPKKVLKHRDARTPPKACEQAAYEAYQFAIAQNPTLKTDQLAYEWLLTRPECVGKLAPSPTAFIRYLRTARVFHEGAAKRKLRWKDRKRPEGITLGDTGNLQECEVIAYESYLYAMQVEPTLKTDLDVYRFLARADREHADQLPASPDTFRRCLMRARRHFGTGKQEARRQAAGTFDLAPCMQIAYTAYLKAMEENPALRSDAQVFNWLKANPTYADLIPPAVGSFRCYLTNARQHYGTLKKSRTRPTSPLEATPCQSNSPLPASSTSTLPEIQTPDRPSANGSPNQTPSAEPCSSPSDSPKT